jgi:hypothetical protein
MYTFKEQHNISSSARELTCTLLINSFCRN